MASSPQGWHVWTETWPKIRSYSINQRLKIGIVGETGQLARAISQSQAARSGLTTFFNRQSLDLSADPEDLRDALSKFDHVDVIINAAAYTAVDRAEEDQAKAFAVNGTAPGIIADYCNKRDIPLVHISTDYVFNGQSRLPYMPEQDADPLNVYGASKLLGEKAIKASGCGYVILRTSWVYDAQGQNFFTTMLRLAETRDELSVVCDQFGRPTYAADLAAACLSAAQNISVDSVKYTGTYHVSGSGPIISWAEFARAIFEIAKPYLKKNMTVHNIPSSEYPTPAKRPSYSALNISNYEMMFDSQMQDWRSSLQIAIDEWQKTN